MTGTHAQHRTHMVVTLLVGEAGVFALGVLAEFVLFSAWQLAGSFGSAVLAAAALSPTSSKSLFERSRLVGAELEKGGEWVEKGCRIGEGVLVVGNKGLVARSSTQRRL